MDFFSLTLAGTLLLILQISVTFHIILHKEDVPSAIGWTGLVWLAPIIGCIFYVLFGINRIRRKAISLTASRGHLFTVTGKTIQEIEKEIPPSFLQLLRLGYKVHPQHVSLGNQLTPLCNGDQAYPRMCEAIKNAKKEVLLASYIFNNDAAGKLFLSALTQAQANGAKVRLLIDGVGLNYSRPNLAQAVKEIPGIELAVFLPNKHPINIPFVNLRNHRKIMIIDGTVAFFGGMNIAQGNLVAQHPKEPIQDVTFEVRGPVLTQMARLFEEDWIFATKKPFRAYASQTTWHTLPGLTPARIIPDGPDADYGKVERLCLGALACAQKNVQIVTPYFLPENEMLSALETAAMRGLQVEIILPQKSNILGMDYAMQANFNRLLAHGVQIYLTKPPFDHSKLFLVDKAWLFAGSANWDVRSFKLNFESNIECFDADLAAQVHQIIEHKKQGAIHLQMPFHTPLWKALRNNTFRLLTPYY